ncbi:zinc metalloprotease [Elasticomyces elasticus]|nr:zinc metalloprotease [Elasticomyces elasticus]
MDLIRSLASTLDSPSIPWKRLIISFSLAQHALEVYLSYRQYLVLKQPRIPRQLKNEIDQKTFDKSQAYGRSKYWFGLVSGSWNQAKSLAVIGWDVYPWLWAVTGSWVKSGGVWGVLRNWGMGGEITHSLVFMFTYSFAETILGLGFSYYHHFVLEEKFGFNKQTPSLWLQDLVKGQALGLALGIPIGAAFLSIIQRTGEKFFLYLWLFTLVVQIGLMTLYPLLIVPIFNKLTPLEPGDLKNRVEALSSKLEFPLAELKVIDGSKRSAHSNAYFTGLPYPFKKTIVLYDTLIAKSTVPEVEAILAHELGHWKMGHTSQLLGISAGHLFFVFGLFSVFINNGSLYEAFGFLKERPIIVGFILFNEVLSPMDSLVKLGMNVWTRRMEFQADAFSYDLGYSKELAASLIKLQIQNLSSMDADWLYSTYNYSHPILTERLKAIGWTSEHKVAGTSTSTPAEKADGGKASEKANGHAEL